MAHILIVEDDDQISALFQENLAVGGHTTERAAEAYDALRRCMRVNFDLVFMDLFLRAKSEGPDALRGENGAVAGAALRGIGYTGPMVIATGGLMPLDQELFNRVGFTGKLLKPVLGKELLDEVDRQLSGTAKKE